MVWSDLIWSCLILCKNEREKRWSSVKIFYWPKSQAKPSQAKPSLFSRPRFSHPRKLKEQEITKKKAITKLYKIVGHGMGMVFYKTTKSMHALWLVNQLWFIVPVNSRKNRGSSELLYKSNRPQVSMVQGHYKPLGMLPATRDLRFLLYQHPSLFIKVQTIETSVLLVQSPYFPLSVWGSGIAQY